MPWAPTITERRVSIQRHTFRWFEIELFFWIFNFFCKNKIQISFSIHYQLKELSIDPANFMSILSEKMLGKPYRWAQDLCGLEFLNTASASTSTNRNYSSIRNELVQLSVPKIVKQIRGRWLARLGLQSQISALGITETHCLDFRDFFFILN